MAGEFYSKVVENCGDIQAELEKVAQAYDLDVHDLWFDLLKVHTLVRFEAKAEYKVLGGENAKQIDDDVFFENTRLSVIQRYDICIKKRLFRYFLDLEVSEENDKLFVVFENPCLIVNNEGLFDEICDYIESWMALNKIILRQMSAQHTAFKKELADYATQDKQPGTILLKSARYTPNKPGLLCFILKENWERKNQEEAPLNAIYGAGEGEVVLEYIKPAQGVSGRDLKGQIVVVKEQEITPFALEYSNEAFDVQDLPTKVVYSSKIAQYVALVDDKLKSFTKNTYTEMKSTGMPMFLGGVEKGPSLHITAKNEIDNAIETNLRVEAKEIFIKGNVGKNVNLVAQKVVIEGQLHADSSVEADEITITNNKGLCKGKNVQCKYADRGTIIAQNCQIEASSGSQIFAKEINLKQVKSNNAFYFSSLCSLENVEGNENKFCFSAFAEPESKQILEETKESMVIYKEKAQKVMAQYQKLNIFVQKHQPTIDKIRNADVATRKALIEEESIKRIYYDFMDCLKRVKILHLYILKIQDLNHKFLDQLVQIEAGMKQAKLHIDSPWTAFNTISCIKTYSGRNQSILTESGEMTDFLLDEEGDRLVRVNSRQHINKF
ncbi:DUF342 domain-containing protein [Helicobacter mehlei]|uniref:DUF342 domain-containing protein n=1 Tax=Helicobacter mehlei TaxID=2316080 RepID=A0A553UX26_9HELI|nr:DUF342 domain-containing protein [Helicobacter mehlei]TSA84571.1 DUF342 domain-containing protein [Helicobacter mehlei]